MEPLWKITLFAELTLTRDGVVTRRFRSRKVASLLAYLAFHRGQACSREFLCEMLWPEEDPVVTRNRLRVTLASLRRQLEPPGVPHGAVLQSVGNGEIRLNPELVATDVAAFERAVAQRDSAQVRALYRGPLVPTLYDEWILAAQERLSAAYENLVTQAAEPFAEAVLPEIVKEKAVVAPEAGTVAPHSPRLPLYLTRFIGREAERERLQSLLADPEVRLVTILGPGGNGKTRLAAETTRMLPELRAFVSLADLWEPRHLFEAICHTLPLTPEPGREPRERIAEFCAQQGPSLIVLDNLEQIALGVAPLISNLLAQAPGLKLLVTSRRRLELPGEQEISLAPLPLPRGTTPEQLSEAASVRLFLDRAQSVRPDTQLTPKNASQIAAICRLLDGVPLALELAAARTGVLTPEQIRQRLEQNSGDLAGVPADKEDRHRSLYAVIEWSYALLPPDLRRFFLALSVFRGGWDLAAAEAVTGEPQALDFLSRLRGHSLVTAEGARFRLLETLRTWAEARQPESEHDVVTHRHGDYFLAFAERCIKDVGGPDESRCLDDLQTDEANIRLCFENAVRTGNAERTLRLALVFSALGRARGSLTETESLLNQALAVPAEDLPALRARTLHTAGALAQLVRGSGAAEPLLTQAHALSLQAGDSILTARILRSLADSALFAHEHDKAQGLYEQALTLQRAANDERGAMQTLNSLALLVVRQQGDLGIARGYLEEIIGYYRRVGDTRMLAYGVYNLGEMALEQGDVAEAERLVNESCALSDELGDSWHRLYCLLLLSRAAGQRGDGARRRTLCHASAALALQLGDQASLAETLLEYAQALLADKEYARAACCLAASETLSAKNIPPDDRRETPFAAVAATVKAHLPDRSFQAAWRRGAALTPAQAAALVTEPASTPARRPS